MGHTPQGFGLQAECRRGRQRETNGSDKDKLGTSLAEAFIRLNRETLLLAYTIFEVSKPRRRDSDEEVYEDDVRSSADERLQRPSRSLVHNERGTLTATARNRLPRGNTEASRVLRELMLVERRSADAEAKAAAEAEKAAQLAAEKADLEDFIESDESAGSSDEEYRPNKKLKLQSGSAPGLRSTGAGARRGRRWVIDSDDE